jgi:thioredoxin-like negative regulator of GroEL
MAQVLQRRQNHGTFVLLHADADDRPDLLQRFGVQEVPTLLVLSDRRVCARLTHPRGCRDIEGLLAPWLK